MGDATQRKIFGVLGDPVRHSKSPRMHNAAFAALGLPHRYAAFHVRERELEDALAGARALGLGGLNLTVPHKQRALAHVDELSACARRSGAVNTVIVRPSAGEGPSILLGDNTDGVGFAAALREQEVAGPPREAVVLGGGGAARAIVDALVHELRVPRIRWITRRVEALTEELRVDRRGSFHRPGVRVVVASYEALARGRGLGATELLVNCTSVGMIGGPPRFPVELDPATLAAGARVVDIVYPRPAGGLLDRAEAAGCHIQDGLPMLLWQGVFALERWLGHPLEPAVIAAMRGALMPR
jgi:shikimate dehydrogenase